MVFFAAVGALKLVWCSLVQIFSLNLVLRVCVAAVGSYTPSNLYCHICRIWMEKPNRHTGRLRTIDGHKLEGIYRGCSFGPVPAPSMDKFRVEFNFWVQWACSTTCVIKFLTWPMVSFCDLSRHSLAVYLTCIIKSFSDFLAIFLFHLLELCPLSCLWTPPGGVGLCCLYTILDNCRLLVRFAQAFLRLNSLSTSAMCSSLWSAWWSSLGFSWCVHACLVLGSLELYRALLNVAHQCWAEMEGIILLNLLMAIFQRSPGCYWLCLPRGPTDSW